MKKLLTSFIFILAVIAISSQDSNAQLYEKGKKVADAGLYFPSGSTIIKAGLSFGVADNVGAGIEANYVNSEFGILGKVNYDFAPALNLGEKIFLYAGGGLGKYFSEGTPVFGVGQLGGGYMVNDKIGFNTEIRFFVVNGSGSLFGLGVVFKLD